MPSALQFDFGGLRCNYIAGGLLVTDFFLCPFSAVFSSGHLSLALVGCNFVKGVARILGLLHSSWNHLSGTLITLLIDQFGMKIMGLGASNDCS